jgi:hypothetical protein
MASLSDKITDVRNAARPTSARVSSSRNAEGNTLACDNLSGWPTASKVHFVTYQLDSNSNPVAGTQLDAQGIVSGNNITSFEVIDGTDNGNSTGDVVEMLPTAAWAQDLADALLASHNRDGTLKDEAVDDPDMLGDEVVTTPKIDNGAVIPDKLSLGLGSSVVATSETTTATSYTDLATAGPSVTVTVGANGILLIIWGAEMANNTANAFAEMSFTLSGANTLAADDTRALRFQAYAGGAIGEYSRVRILTGLNPGSTTVTAKYAVQTGGGGSGTGTFLNREIFAIPL